MESRIRKLWRKTEGTLVFKQMLSRQPCGGRKESAEQGASLASNWVSVTHAREEMDAIHHWESARRV